MHNRKENPIKSGQGKGMECEPSTRDNTTIWSCKSNEIPLLSAVNEITVSFPKF